MNNDIPQPVGHKKVTPWVLAPVMRGAIPKESQVFITDADGNLHKVECVAYLKDGQDGTEFNDLVITTYEQFDKMAEQRKAEKCFSDQYFTHQAGEERYE